MRTKTSGSWESALWPFAQCRICGEDFASLLHFGWSDERSREHDFDARQDDELPPARYSVNESELPY